MKAVTLQPRGTVSAVKKIIASAKKTPQTAQHGIYSIGGRYIACDGYRAVSLVSDIPDLPHTERGFDIRPFIKNAAESSETTVELPSIHDLKVLIAAENKAAKVNRNHTKAPICISGFWYCNPKFLLEMLQALPECTAYMPQDAHSAMYFLAPDGSEGILMPVRPPEKSVSAA